MKRNETIVEILIWISILAVVTGGVVFVHHKFYVKPNTYTIRFKDIDGITKGSPVRFMGINIGHVRKLTSVDKSVIVQIFVTQKNLKIPKGTLARVEFYGLGGSKSIELMPSNSKDAQGIVTTDTIRIADVAKSAKSFVQILELMDKYAQSLDKSKLQNILENIEGTNPDKIREVENEMNKFNHQISTKVKDVKEKQSNMVKTINKADETVLKINKFVKK